MYKSKVYTRNILAPNCKLSESSENLIKKSSLVDIRIIHSGNLRVKLSNTINLRHPSCSEISDKEISAPIFAYLLHHEKFGYFLIDSGCESSYVNNPYGPMKGLLFPLVMPKTDLKSHESIDNQLSKTELENIRAVFFTHLHFDHTSGLPALPGNPIYIAGKGEIAYSIKWLLEPNHFKRKDIIYRIDFNTKSSQTFPIGKSVDIFGDQTMWAISTPGHSKGHISYLINSKDGPVLIAGDACIRNKSLEIGVGPGTSSNNLMQAQRTLDKICAFVKSNPTVKVWCGHDFPK
jgi:glyoxylase-like metal-dependent hydrolase (beta-lactamase superfamily II)